MDKLNRKAQDEQTTSSVVQTEHQVVNPTGVSTPPSPKLPQGEVANTDISQLFTDYHLTVQLNVHLERRQISLLLSVLNYQAVHYGVNFEMYLSILHLYELLVGGKLRASEIKDRYERQTAEVSQIIIRDLAGTELAFGQTQRVEVSTKTSRLLTTSGSLISKDVYKSRFTCWRPERLLRLKTVPVGVKIERDGMSVRYSSYCKGYGEGGGTARRRKTSRCSELDGEDIREFILGMETQDLAQEVFLVAHYEWLKRFGKET